MCLAVPGKVVQIDRSDPLTLVGKVDFAGIIKEISLAFVPEVEVGDYVIVHAGFALNIIDGNEADTVFDYLKQSSGQ